MSQSDNVKSLKKRLQRLRQILFNNKCMFCLSDDKLHFMHIEPTKMSGLNRGRSMWIKYMDIKRNFHCYFLACQKCHYHIDSYERKIEINDLIGLDML